MQDSDCGPVCFPFSLVGWCLRCLAASAHALWCWLSLGGVNAFVTSTCYFGLTMLIWGRDGRIVYIGVTFFFFF